MYSWSRGCLWTGILIAILGVFLFYFVVLYKNEIVDEVIDNYTVERFLFILVSCLPKFGIFFFVEYVAFFFLKQYRILQEEYRYYEAVKRERQHNMLILKLIKESSKTEEKVEYIIECLGKHAPIVPKFTGNHKVKSEKMVYDDMDLFSKITDLVKIIRKDV